MIKYLKKYWMFAILGPLFMIGEVSMDLLQPRLMSRIVDEGVLGLSNNYVGDLQLIISVGLQMIGTVVLGGLFGILAGVFANLCSQNFGNDIRKDCFRRMMSFSFEQTDAFSTGSLVTRVTNDVTQVQNLVAQLIRGCVRTGMFFCGGIFCMMTLDLSFGVIVLCALPVVLVFTIYFILKANPNFKILQKKLDRVNNVMQENVSGARVVKAYVREEYEEDRFSQANDELVNTQLTVLKLFALMTPITNIILNMTIVAIIKMGAIRVQAGGVTPGNVMAAITYVSQIMQGVMMIAMIFQTISRGIASGNRLKEILECEPVIKDGTVLEENTPYMEQNGTNQTKSINKMTKHHSKNVSQGLIEFRNVCFSYPNSSGEMVLQHINLTINPGETLAILGMTGSGKSSMVNLIPRFYDVTEGAVLVDGVNVKDYKLSDLRDKVSIALQKSELFSTTIGENVTWGKANATEQEIQQAICAAQASEFINSKPEGLETVVAERGMSLSGGQKQRVAISRALLKNSEILILDDSTSALDLKTEAKLNQALQSTYQHVTKIIIAQRIASVMRADRIAILDNGELIACDSHEKLLQNCSIYQDIYNSQLKSNQQVKIQDISNNGVLLTRNTAGEEAIYE